jgi:transcriptional regulator with XRE-family HTH domain
MAAERLSSDPAFLAAFGEVVRMRREELGMDRRELAEASGISYSYLSAIESGQKLPSGTYQTMLADTLQISPTELLAQANGALGASTADHMESRARMSVRRAVASPNVGISGEMFDVAPEPTREVTPWGAMTELEALAGSLSSEDLSMVVSMARRLAASGDQNRGARRRDRQYRGRAGRESRTEAYLRFWTMYLAGLESRGLDWAYGRKPEPRSYFTTPSPIRGSSFSASFARNRLLRHEMYINRGSREANVELLHDLEANRGIIEGAYGATLDFEDPGQERRAVRIAEYRDGHISRSDEFPTYVDWFIDRGERMRQALSAYERGSE